LVGLLGLDPPGAVAPVVRLGRFVLVVVLVLGLGGDAVLEDGVEVGFDVVGIDLVLVVLLLLLVATAAAPGLRGRGLGGGGRFRFEVDLVLVVALADVFVIAEVVVERVLGLGVFLQLVRQLVGLFAEVLVEGVCLEVFVVRGFVVSHRVPSRVGLARP